MEISKKQIEITTLYASEGYYLTKVNCDETCTPIMTTKVILGKTDSADNYKEIPISEGDAIVAQWNAQQELEILKEDKLIQEQQITDATVNTLNSTTNYIPPMEIFKGKYYIQDDVIYECIRNSEKPLNNNLCDLIGLYVYKV